MKILLFLPLCLFHFHFCFAQELPADLLSDDNLEESKNDAISKKNSQLEHAQLRLEKKITNIWNWQQGKQKYLKKFEQLLKAKKKRALPKSALKVKKLYYLVKKAKERLPGLFEGKLDRSKQSFLQESISKNIEKIQLSEDLFTQINLLNLQSDSQQYHKDLEKKIHAQNDFGLSESIWQKCSYNHEGLFILDMTSHYWQTLSPNKQKDLARIYREKYAQYIGRHIEKNFKLNCVSMVMALIPPGRYFMGSPADEMGRKSDEIRHKVVIGHPYYIGKYEVTQYQWEAVMMSNPSHFRGANLPVEQVSWYDCLRFCQKTDLRLPTEAEWEYACRAGTTGPFNTGANISTNIVNYNGNYPYLGGKRGIYRRKTVAIAELTNGNAWRCFDFHGNIWEWNFDWYGSYTKENAVEPIGASTSLYRVTRGGGWSAYASGCRCADRSKNEPGFRFIYLGFRAAAEIK